LAVILHCLNLPELGNLAGANPEDATASLVPPEGVVALAKQNRKSSIAYTYTDPIAYYEYAYDTSRLGKQAGLRNVLVTAGYCNPNHGNIFSEVTDAARVDLKRYERWIFIESFAREQ